MAGGGEVTASCDTPLPRPRGRGTGGIFAPPAPHPRTAGRVQCVAPRAESQPPWATSSSRVFPLVVLSAQAPPLRLESSERPPHRGVSTLPRHPCAKVCGYRGPRLSPPAPLSPSTRDDKTGLAGMSLSHLSVKTVTQRETPGLAADNTERPAPAPPKNRTVLWSPPRRGTIDRHLPNRPKQGASVRPPSRRG